jgi:hypothetical protein
VRQRLGDFPPDPIRRVLNPASAGPISHAQPARPDHYQQHAAGPHPLKQLLNKVTTRRNGATVQEDLIIAEPGCELAVDEDRSGLAVITAVVDENAGHFDPPCPPPLGW